MTVITQEHLDEVESEYRKWAGGELADIRWGIPGGVTDNTQQVLITCSEGDYVVAHDYDRNNIAVWYIEVVKFYSNEYKNKVFQEYLSS